MSYLKQKHTYCMYVCHYRGITISMKTFNENCIECINRQKVGRPIRFMEISTD
jgi:hypothetical protein